MFGKDASAQLIRLSEYHPPNFLIDTTSLRFELFETETIVTAKLVIRRNPESPTPNEKMLVLHAEQMHVLEVLIDDTSLNTADYTHENDLLTIPVASDKFSIQTKVRIHPENNTSLMGLYKSKTMFCTQCEAEGFRKITPYLDRPDVMSEFTTTLVADPKRYPVLLSNGNLINEKSLPDGRKEVVWQDPFRKPAYLFALVAGDLESIDDSFTTMSGRDVLIRIFVEAKDLDKCDHALRSLKAAMKWDEETYGREYDLDIFMIVAVDDFNMGAMENKGLNIFNTSAVLANPKTTTDARFQWVEAVVAHEYFHNWSGNRVTCRDWFQLSLKEGFTVFRDSEFSADLNSRTVKRIEDVRTLQAYQFAEDAGPLAHPVQPDSYMEINNFYTLTVYEKGSEVVRMQANLLGPELFRQGTDLYFQRHDGQAVTIEDFVACMEEVSGLDLSQFKRWYKQAGTPQLDVESAYDEANGELSLTFSQSCPPTPESSTKQPFLIPVRMGLVGSHGDLPIHSAEAGFHGETDAVVKITEAEQTVVFTGLQEKPAVSMLRGFSAPVKLQTDNDDDALLRLMRGDSDGFNRWDAGQRLAVKAIFAKQTALQTNTDYEIDPQLLAAYRELLDPDQADKAMIALMLTLPSMNTLSELTGTIELDTLFQARRSLYLDFANQLGNEFRTLYLSNLSEEPFEPSAIQIAQRSLKNICMTYWLSTEQDDAVDAVVQQFERAENMTDQAAALTALVNASGDRAARAAETALGAFYQQWQGEALVVNQWLAVQASARSPNNLARVQSLMTHPAFDTKNPNKLRSLIGGFCQLDPNNFHHQNGSGYEFLANQVMALNASNPQIASRLVQPLTKWRKQDDKRADLMRSQLERIAASDNLSSDVNELVTKSLV